MKRFHNAYPGGMYRSDDGDYVQVDDPDSLAEALIQHVRNLERQVEDLQDSMRWRPIETAPVDGTVILGLRNGKVRESYRVQRDDCEMWVFGGTSASVEVMPSIKPEYWMPMPPNLVRVP